MKDKSHRVAANHILWQLAIDRDVLRKFKARCAEVGKTMREVVEELVIAWLKKKE